MKSRFILLLAALLSITGVANSNEIILKSDDMKITEVRSIPATIKLKHDEIFHMEIIYIIDGIKFTDDYFSMRGNDNFNKNHIYFRGKSFYTNHIAKLSNIDGNWQTLSFKIDKTKEDIDSSDKDITFKLYSGNLKSTLDKIIKPKETKLNLLELSETDNIKYECALTEVEIKNIIKRIDYDYIEKGINQYVNTMLTLTNGQYMDTSILSSFPELYIHCKNSNLDFFSGSHKNGFDYKGELQEYFFLDPSQYIALSIQNETKLNVAKNSHTIFPPTKNDIQNKIEADLPIKIIGINKNAVETIKNPISPAFNFKYFVMAINSVISYKSLQKYNICLTEDTACNKEDVIEKIQKLKRSLPAETDNAVIAYLDRLSDNMIEKLGDAIEGKYDISDKIVLFQKLNQEELDYKLTNNLRIVNNQLSTSDKAFYKQCSTKRGIKDYVEITLGDRFDSKTKELAVSDCCLDIGKNYGERLLIIANEISDYNVSKEDIEDIVYENLKWLNFTSPNVDHDTLPAKSAINLIVSNFNSCTSRVNSML